MSEKNLILEKSFDIRWVDMDAYQHLNNAKFYDFMTECRVASFWQFNEECNFIVSENSCKYKKPVHFPAILHIKQYIKNISSISFECVYIFEKNEQEVAEGFAKIVCFDPIKKKPCKIPEKIKPLLLSTSAHVNI